MAMRMLASVLRIPRLTVCRSALVGTKSAFSNFTVCADPATTCALTTVAGQDAYRCKVECDASNETICSNGEACIENGFVGELAVTDPAGDPNAQDNWVSCETSASCAGGFECIELTVGSYCGKFGGWCGSAVSFCEDSSSLDGLAAPVTMAGLRHAVSI